MEGVRGGRWRGVGGGGAGQIFQSFFHSCSPSRCSVILIDLGGVGNWEDWIEERGCGGCGGGAKRRPLP